MRTLGRVGCRGLPRLYELACNQKLRAFNHTVCLTVFFSRCRGEGPGPRNWRWFRQDDDTLSTNWRCGTSPMPRLAALFTDCQMSTHPRYMYIENVQKSFGNTLSAKQLVSFFLLCVFFFLQLSYNKHAVGANHNYASKRKILSEKSMY